MSVSFTGRHGGMGGWMDHSCTTYERLFYGRHDNDIHIVRKQKKEKSMSDILRGDPNAQLTAMPAHAWRPQWAWVTPLPLSHLLVV